MNRDYLIETASKIKSPSQTSYLEYHSNFEILLAEINNGMLKRDEISKIVGDDNVSMMKDNHANHIRFMSSLFRYYIPEVFVDTVAWVFRAYRNHGFTSNYWAVQMNSWMSILKNQLSEKAYLEIYPFYEWIQVNIPTFVKLSDTEISAPNSLH